MGKADLHLHTTVSDGMASVAAMLEYVERHTDLDVIAITDHEDATGGHRARELAAKRGFRFEVIVGAEVTSRHGHIIGLGVERAPSSFRSVEYTLEAIHAQGGIAIAPHPMSWLTRSVSQRTLDRVQARAEPGVTFDAIELANPSPAGRLTRGRALAGNSRWRLAAIGSSDAHHLLHAGRGWTEFAGSSAADLQRAITAGSTIPAMTPYPSLREVGYRQTALGLAWGYAATPRKVIASAGRLGRRR